MKTTSIKGVLSFCVAVTVTVAMAYSAVTVIQKNNAATEKAVKESQAIGSEVSTDSLKDGEYEGTATGYGGPLTVRITIKGGKLTDIKVVSHTETPEYFSRASAVIGKILNSGNVNVDSVSGATISSNAIKKAVADALRKAGSKQKAKMSTVKKDTRNANLNDGVSTESGSGVSTDNLKDGEYEATATGYGGPLTVRITIKGGKLTDIKVVSHTETPEYFSRASAVIGKILNSGNVNVDSVSGATISSNAIKKAVADALRKAGSKQQAKMSTVKKDTRNANLNDRVSTGSGSEVSTDSLNLNDGVYTGSGQGFNGPIRVRVTVSGGNITNVEILSHSDDAPYFNRAKAVIGRLLGKPGKSVDTVSGATYSSRGIIDAVRNALANAGKTNITNTNKPNKPNNNNSNTNKPNNNNNNTPGTGNTPPFSEAGDWRAVIR